MGCATLRPDRPLSIAGAGPAGLSCAIQLASAGVAVEVHEARGVVGGRFHGGHQLLPCFGARPRAADLLGSLGVRPDDLELVPLRSAGFEAGGGRRVTATSADPYALLIRRGPDAGTLDTALLRRAQEVGVTVHVGSRLEAAQADVVATGPAQVDGLAMEMVFRTASADRVEVLMDRALTPDGYAYLFVCRGRGTLGVTTLSDYRRLDELLHQALARFERAAVLEPQEPRVARAAMSFFVPRTACPGGRPRVGEAAGFQDYLYGLGIRSALLSGTLAARALVAGADYDRLWKPVLRRRMQASLVERYLYETSAHGGERLLDVVQGTDLRHALDRVQSGTAWKLLLLPWVAARWARHDHRCRHGATAHWCRRPCAERGAVAPEPLRDEGLTAEGSP